MGRIKTLLVKRITRELVNRHSEKFSTEFEGNKRILMQYIPGTSKKLKNTIAGYVTRLKKPDNAKRPIAYQES
ncbi:MAG: 30S ribosomal protein S17e [archaeon]